MGKALEILGVFSVFIGIAFLYFQPLSIFAFSLSINGLSLYALGAIYISVYEIKAKIK